MTQSSFNETINLFLEVQDTVPLWTKLKFLRNKMGSDSFDESLIIFMKEAWGDFLLSDLNELTFDSHVPKMFFSLYGMRDLLSPVVKSIVEDRIDRLYSFRRVGFLGGDKS